MQKQYTVINMAFGDGSADFGRRFSSFTFNTRKAAEECQLWLDKINPAGRSIIIEDSAQ